MEVPVTVVPLAGEHWEWIQRHTSPALCKDTTGLVAMRGDQIVGAVVFGGFSPNSCSVHIAIEDPRVVKRLLQMSGEFVFLHAKRQVVLGMTPADNERALRLNSGVGFKEVHRIKDGYKKGVDFVLQELRQEDCKWFKLPMEIAA